MKTNTVPGSLITGCSSLLTSRPGPAQIIEKSPLSSKSNSSVSTGSSQVISELRFPSIILKELTDDTKVSAPTLIISFSVQPVFKLVTNTVYSPYKLTVGSGRFSDPASTAGPVQSNV